MVSAMEKENIDQTNFWWTSLKRMPTSGKLWTLKPHIHKPSFNKTPCTGFVIKNSTFEYVVNIRLKVNLKIQFKDSWQEGLECLCPTVSTEPRTELSSWYVLNKYEFDEGSEEWWGTMGMNDNWWGFLRFQAIICELFRLFVCSRDKIWLSTQPKSL